MVDNALVTRASLYYGLEEIDARTNGKNLFIPQIAGFGAENL